MIPDIPIFSQNDITAAELFDEAKTLLYFVDSDRYKDKEDKYNESDVSSECLDETGVEIDYSDFVMYNELRHSYDQLDFNTQIDLNVIFRMFSDASKLGNLHSLPYMAKCKIMSDGDKSIYAWQSAFQLAEDALMKNESNRGYDLIFEELDNWMLKQNSTKHSMKEGIQYLLKDAYKKGIDSIYYIVKLDMMYGSTTETEYWIKRGIAEHVNLHQNIGRKSLLTYDVFVFLAKMYYTGTHIVSDLSEAYYWLLLAEPLYNPLIHAVKKGILINRGYNEVYGGDLIEDITSWYIEKMNDDENWFEEKKMKAKKDFRDWFHPKDVITSKTLKQDENITASGDEAISKDLSDTDFENSDWNILNINDLTITLFVKAKDADNWYLLDYDNKSKRMKKNAFKSPDKIREMIIDLDELSKTTRQVEKKEITKKWSSSNKSINTNNLNSDLYRLFPSLKKLKTKPTKCEYNRSTRETTITVNFKLIVK